MKSNKLRLSVVICFGVLCAAITWQYLRPIPNIAANKSSLQTIPAKAFAPAWPPYGQSAVGAAGYGTLGTYGKQTSFPTASVAKVITALAVLEKKPLETGQQGPTITLDAQDVQYFENHYVVGGSVVAVKAGEKITEYQALQAMLLPSGNNMADSLARWAFGSQKAYLDYANSMLKKFGLTNTDVADASGLSPSTVSTAEDLMAIGQKAIKTPVLAEIVNQPTATLPVAGKVNNVNWLLGVDGIVGIKTGNTDQAGGNFLFAANRVVDGQKVEVLGVILGAPLRNTAINDSRALIQSLDKGFEKVSLVKKGQVLGSYALPWGENVNAVASSSLNGLIWKGQPSVFSVSMKPVSVGDAQGEKVGILTVTNAKKQFSTSIVLSNSVPAPPLKWKLLRN